MQCSSLLDESCKEEFLDDITDLYDDIRYDHYESLTQKKYLSLEEARAKSLKLDWDNFKPCRPSFLGTKVFLNYNLEQLIPIIDWRYFFDVWQLRGRYPNSRYPRIFKDKNVGDEARRLFDDAQKLLRHMLDDNLLEARAIIGFYPANSKGDDIVVFDPKDSVTPVATLYGLRQQMETEGQKNYLCISDYIAPIETGYKDYIGIFATSAGFGIEELCAKYNKDHDDYNSIMVQALADRLSEALAEKIHQDVRTTYWGYSPGEDLSTADLLKVAYDGIRPAAGYPTQPDHTEKRTMWKLADISNQTDINLTESLAMLPAASVSGLYFANPASTYFSVGKIQKDQVNNYLARSYT